MKTLPIFMLAGTIGLWAQAVFAPKPYPRDLIKRFFKEDPWAETAKRHDFQIRVDDRVGKTNYHWLERGQSVDRVLYHSDRLRGSLECLITGDRLPLRFTYRFAFESTFRESSLAWRIASLCKDQQRFRLPSVDALLRKDVEGFDLAVFNRFILNPGFFKGFPAIFSGGVVRENRKPIPHFTFDLTYESYCLPAVVACQMEGGFRPESAKNSKFGADIHPEFVEAWFAFEVRHHGEDRNRRTLGPGLDGEKISNAELIQELIRNVQAAKDDHWIPWGEGENALVACLEEMKTLQSTGMTKELASKLDGALRMIEPMKGKGRSEFHTLVHTYLVLMKRRMLDR